MTTADTSNTFRIEHDTIAFRLEHDTTAFRIEHDTIAFRIEHDTNPFRIEHDTSLLAESIEFGDTGITPSEFDFM